MSKAAMMLECIPPDSVIALLYALSTYLRLTVHYFNFHTPLEILSQRSHYVPSADSDAPRLLCFHPLDQPFSAPSPSPETLVC